MVCSQLAVLTFEFESHWPHRFCNIVSWSITNVLTVWVASHSHDPSLNLAGTTNKIFMTTRSGLCFILVIFAKPMTNFSINLDYVNRKGIDVVLGNRTRGHRRIQFNSKPFLALKATTTMVNLKNYLQSSIITTRELVVISFVVRC